MAEDTGTVADLEAKRREAEEAASGLNGNGNGRSIEDLAEGGETVEDEEGQTLIDFGDQLNLSLKGKKPSESKLKIRGVQRDISGQLGDKGDDEDYVFIVVGRLHKLEVPYRRDEAGRTVSKKRVHELTPIEVIRVPDELVEDFLTRASG